MEQAEISDLTEDVERRENLLRIIQQNKNDLPALKKAIDEGGYKDEECREACEALRKIYLDKDGFYPI